MELTGRTNVADAYDLRDGPAFQKKLDDFFQ